MKTTVEISDSLISRARQAMKTRRVTLRALIEDGLTRVLEEETTDDDPLPRAIFPGRRGFAPGVTEADLPGEIAAVLHQGRNGGR